DPVLGPEMRSTGEVLGLASTPGMAYYKSQNASQQKLPTNGTVLFSIAGADKSEALGLARKLRVLGFDLLATSGTQEFFQEHGVPAKTVCKMHEGRPNITDAIENKQVQLIVNTPIGKMGTHDDSYIRKAAIKNRTPYVTTIAAAKATVMGIEEMSKGEPQVLSLQEYHKLLK
ncbi:MAG: carbamoyl phosphate synthase large subunit, partial [Victivallales bacterium]|nr:carbamoyl phosphate synthase large subunit [Victivallales bacterium]